MQNKLFKYEEALEKLKSGQPITGEDGVLTPLLKQMAEALLQGEVDAHLESDPQPNRRNGKSRKQVKSGSGAFELETPRDRAGTFEPQLVKKNQTALGNHIEAKILGLYGLGNSYRDIATFLKELYCIEVSTGTISASRIKSYQSRKPGNNVRLTVITRLFG